MSMQSNISCSVNGAGQAVTVVTFPDGVVAEVVIYINDNALQVTVDSSNSHGVTVTVDDNDVCIVP